MSRVHRATPSRGRAGFTLLELLVAITLLGLLLTGLLGGLRLGARAWETGAARLESDARLLAVQGFLRQRLAGAVPVLIPREDDRPPLAFEGRPRRATFVGTLPGPLEPGLQRFTLWARRDGRGGRHLAIAWDPLLPDADGIREEPADGPSRRRDLIAGIEGVSFAYYGALDRSGTAAWHDSWSGDDLLPTLVRLRVQLEEGDPRTFPELVVRPSIDIAPYVDQ